MGARVKNTRASGNTNQPYSFSFRLCLQSWTWRDGFSVAVGETTDRKDRSRESD